jgi:hypothetical protein
MEVKQIFVSSENRDTTLYPYGNSYTLHITEPIKDIAKVELLYASVPNTIYNITDGTNVIALSNVTSNATDGLTQFSIPQGFYNASTLASELTQAVGNVTGITVSYLGAEGKFLLSRPVAQNNFASNILSSELATMMGFDNNVLKTSTNVPVSSGTIIPLYSDHTRYRDKEFLKSDRVINMAPNEGIFLDIHELRTNFNEDAKAILSGDRGTYSGLNVSRTFGLIPMDANAGSIKHFKKTSDYDFCVDYVYPIRKLDRLTIQWVDRFGRPVSFNGLEDNSFILRFHTLRKNLH